MSDLIVKKCVIERGFCLVLILVFLSVSCEQDSSSPSPGIADGLRVSTSGGSEISESPDEVRNGDVFLSFSRTDESGKSVTERFDSFLDWLYLAEEILPQRSVLVRCSRENVVTTLTLDANTTSLRFEPLLPSALLETWRSLVGSTLFDQSETLLPEAESLLSVAQTHGRADIGWYFLHCGSMHEKSAGQRENALRGVDRALDIATQHDLLEGLALSHYLRGLILLSGESYPEAESEFSLAVTDCEKTRLTTLFPARCFEQLGKVTWYQGRLDEAETWHRRALEIRERLVPNSEWCASSYNNLGIIADERGSLDLAEEFYLKALTIRRKGDSFSPELADTLNNLAIVHHRRGDYATAEHFFLEVLEIDRTSDPDGLGIARSLTNLGITAHRRKDFDAAELYYQQALSIERDVAPDSMDVAMSLTNLAAVARQRGDYKNAEKLALQSLHIKEMHAPQSLEIARSYNNLGTIAQDCKDYAAALKFFNNAMKIKRKLAPRSLEVVRSFNNLGAVHMKLNDISAAQSCFEQAIEIIDDLAPSHYLHAEALHALGMITLSRQDPVTAERLFTKAIDVLEAQYRILGGIDVAKAGFQDAFYTYYRDLISLQVAREKNEQAFLNLERSRAQSLLGLLAERKLTQHEDLPVSLEMKRTTALDHVDRAQQELWKASLSGETEKRDRSRLALTTSIAELESVIGEIKKVSPHFASLHYPEPIDCHSLVKTLDSGTLLLSYSTGAKETILFSISRTDPLETTIIPMSLQQLQLNVRDFRTLIQQISGRPTHLASIAAAGKELYDLLIKPVEHRIQNNQRILIIPDGPLHVLPFSALTVEAAAPSESKGRMRFLIEDIPVHIVQSATIYAELQMMRKQKALDSQLADCRIVAFGNPVYPDLTSPDLSPLVGYFAKHGLQLSPLPGSGREIESIKGVCGPNAVLFAGEHATEERFRVETPAADIVHLACHGFIDEDFPLNSGVVLTMSSGNSIANRNGFLQAWELFQTARLSAKLVVLSGCQTATGREHDGEGLLSLVRAFHYAGSSAVIASLWNVADQSTVDLMTRLYREIQAGKPFDEALRTAQLTLIQRPNNNLGSIPVSQPFFWAAFQLHGCHS